MKNFTLTIGTLLVSAMAWGQTSTYHFKSLGKNQSMGSFYSQLSDKEIGFLTYITDGIVTDGGESQYKLHDNERLPVEERKLQTAKKAVRVVHGEYSLWVAHNHDPKVIYQNFLKSYPMDRLVKEVSPYYGHKASDKSVKTYIYFPCNITKTFESLRALPKSDFAQTLNAEGYLTEKVNTYFKNFILDQKVLNYEQIVKHSETVQIENESMLKAIKNNELIPLGSVTQELFNFNQFIRWGDIRFNFFTSPKNPSATLIYVESRLAMRADFMAIGPDKKGAYKESEMGILLQAPLEDYLMGDVPFFKKDLGQIQFFGYEVNPKIDLGGINISDLLEAFDTLVGVSTYKPSEECQKSQGPSILMGLPKFQQNYIDGFAQLYKKL